MIINNIHSFDYNTESDFCKIQKSLMKNIKLTNNFCINNVKLCAGIDLAYWEYSSLQYAVCCIVVINIKTKQIIEKVNSCGTIHTKYIPSYLAFRELPLIIEASKQLKCDPDIFMFDGNGYLHPNHMGIATHASLFLDKPSIGVAKSYFKINDVEYIEPENVAGKYADIIIENEIYGRALRTKQNVKPIFISCGNYIDIDTAVNISMSLVGKESRLPIPVWLADLETHKDRELFKTKIF